MKPKVEKLNLILFYCVIEIVKTLIYAALLNQYQQTQKLKINFDPYILLILNNAQSMQLSGEENCVV